MLHIPAHGRLIASTDLHGNYGDFLALKGRFEEALESHDGDAFLLLCGDLIHGPIYTRRNWPRRLGSYYPDESAAVVDGFLELRDRHPGRVFALLGNHEHSHLGGPFTRKFHKIPSETEFFEQSVGEDRAEYYRKVFASLPLVAVAGRGLVFTHGAPRVLASSIHDIAAIDTMKAGARKINAMFALPVVGELLWCRQTGSLALRRFLRLVEVDGQRNGVVLYGHDPISSGFDRRSPEQICFSTSFGLKDKNKVYVEIDLAKTYRVATDLQEGQEILSLYPKARTSGRLPVEKLNTSG